VSLLLVERHSVPKDALCVQGKTAPRVEAQHALRKMADQLKYAIHRSRARLPRTHERAARGLAPLRALRS